MYFSKAPLFFTWANLHLFKWGYWRHQCDLKAKISDIVWDCVWQASASNKQWYTVDCVTVISESPTNSQAVYFLSKNKYQVVFGDSEIWFVVIMAYFRFGKEQKDYGVHRTSNEQQGCATILRSVKITVTVSPEPTQRNTVTRTVSCKMEKASIYNPIKSKNCLF